MATNSIRGCASFILVALAGGAALAGPLPGGGVDLDAFDVSFQDGRTHSQIRGPMVVNKVLGIAESGDPDDQGPMSVCFAEGTDPAVMAAVNAAIAGGYQSRYELGQRWVGVIGEGVEVTWSFVPDGLSIPASGQIQGEQTGPSILFSRMDQLFNGQGGRATWIAQFNNAFARWSSLTGLTYARVQNGANDWDDGAAWGSASSATRGMVRISMRNIDGGSNILAYNQFPQNGDMVIDSSETWGASNGGYLFLRNTIMHEHGHGLGFEHSCPGNSTKLMEPLLATNFDGPQLDDIRAGHAHYGDSYEPNNSAAGASQLGTLTPGQNLTLGLVPFPTVANAATLSIDASGEVDWYAVQLDDPRLVDITVTPVGATYLAGPQNFNGTCSAGTTDASLSAADLLITVYKSNGSAVLRTNNESGAGGTESISGLLLGSGTSYIRVSQTGSFSGVQLYRLNILVRSTNLNPNASDGSFTDKVTVSWPAVPDAASYQVYRNVNDATFGGTNVSPVLSSATLSFEDTTAAPGQVYYYFVKVVQPDDAGFRFMTDSGNQGRRNAPPVANAGIDQTVTDTDGSGAELVTLDGSASSDVDGNVSTYRWAEGATVYGQSASPTASVSLGVGVHTITLTVFDNNGASNTDTVVVTVNPQGGGCPGNQCGPSDYNGDGDVGTDQDIEAFFACLGGNCCPACWCQGADFNGDGDVGTDQDIEAFFRVLGGGSC